MTALFAALLLLIAGVVVFDRRRHVRLKTACTAAFEMGYSYGEPVFQVGFGSRAAQQAAAAANAAFLAEIGELCKDRGRKRRFKAERAVFFQHPEEDRPVVTHCCATMRAQVGRAIAYDEHARAYGLRTSIVGTPALPIAHCPWCGGALPPA